MPNIYKGGAQRPHFPHVRENRGAARAVNQLRGIFDNTTLDYKDLKKCNQGNPIFQIHRTESGDILAVSFNEYIIIDLRAEGFDLTRLDYKPQRKRAANCSETKGTSVSAQEVRHPSFARCRRRCLGFQPRMGGRQEARLR